MSFAKYLVTIFNWCENYKSNWKIRNNNLKENFGSLFCNPETGK